MMRRAAGYHAARALLVSAGVAVLFLAGREGYGRNRAQVLQDRLLGAATEDVPEIVRAMGPYRRWVDARLQSAYASAVASHDSRRQLHASLGLLPVSRGQAGYLRDRLLTATPQELFVIRDALKPEAAEVSPWLWRVAQDQNRLPDERLRAACAGGLRTGRPTLARVCGELAPRLAGEPGLVFARWAEALRPVRQALLPSLAALLGDDGHDAAVRRTITDLFGDYAQGLPDSFALLENQAAGVSERAADLDDQLARQRRQANAAAALARLGRWQSARTLLQFSLDPTVRSYLIDRLGPGGADAAKLVNLLVTDGDVWVRRAALLALGEFDDDRLPRPMRERLTTQIADLYHDDPDPGIHAAAGWLLGQWGQQDRLKPTDRDAALRRLDGSRRWYVSAEGQTMVVIPAGRFQRGFRTPPSFHEVDHGIAIAAREVTIADFRRFRRDYAPGQLFARTDDCPAHMLSWYDAAAYCNWLSERDGLPREQWCYLPNKDGRYADGMKLAPDFLTRTGYRLPTQTEWEYACRAGTVTRWALGEAEDLLTKYAWCVSNAWSRLHPVGTLRPNDLGLFDMHGNAWEWCQDVDAKSAADVVTDADERPIRGGAFGHGPLTILSSNFVFTSASVGGGDVGFRPARTLP